MRAIYHCDPLTLYAAEETPLQLKQLGSQEAAAEDSTEGLDGPEAGPSELPVPENMLSHHWCRDLLLEHVVALASQPPCAYISLTTTKDSKAVLVNSEATQFEGQSILSPLLFSPASLPLESLLNLNIWHVRQGAVVAVLNSRYFPWEQLAAAEQKELSALLLELSNTSVEVLQVGMAPSAKHSLCMQLLDYGLCSV